MRIIALDIGEVRIGVASCDSLEIASYPAGTLRRLGTLKRDISLVAARLRELEAEIVVVGLPLSLDGDEGPQAQRIKGFAAALVRELTVPMEFWDESMTSVEASGILIQMGASRSKRRDVLDQMAAVLLLEGYLADRRRRGVAP